MNKRTLSNRAYGFLKWFCIAAIPALTLFYPEVAALFGWENVSEVTRFLGALGVFLASLIGVSGRRYNQQPSSRPAGTLKVLPGRSKNSVKYSIEFDDDSVFDLAENPEVRFRIDDSAVREVRLE